MFLKQCEDSQNKFYEILNNEIRKHKKPSNVIDMCETIILDDISDKEDEDDDDKMEVDEIPDPIKIIVKRNGTIGSISASKEIIKCKTCNSMFVNSETYETHYKNTHRKKSSSHQLANNQLKVKKMFKCKECRQMFDDLTVYEDHYNNLHSILCEVCHYKFKSFGDCFEHQIKDHKVDILTEIFKCKICSIGFHKTLEYREHMKVHKLEEQSLTSFVCNTCSKEFKSRASLKVHMGTHSEFNNNLCESCGKSFSSATYLSEHILLIHTLEANLQCHLCPHKFKTQKKFDKHIKLHSAEKKIQCEFCPIKFKTRNVSLINFANFILISKRNTNFYIFRRIIIIE